MDEIERLTMEVVQEGRIPGQAYLGPTAFRMFMDGARDTFDSASHGFTVIRMFTTWGPLYVRRVPQEIIAVCSD